MQRSQDELRRMANKQFDKERAARAATSARADLRAAWLKWARENIGGTEAQIQAAVTALAQADAAGAKGAEAISAARAAAAAVAPPGRVATSPNGPTVPRSGTATTTPAAQLAGGIVGTAREIQRGPQWVADGGVIPMLEFRLYPEGGTPMDVQLRGERIDGVLKDGDIVEVERRYLRDGLLLADRVFNHTTNSMIRALRGVSGQIAMKEARWGTGWAQAAFIWRIVAPIFAIVIFLGFIALMLYIGDQSDKKHHGLMSPTGEFPPTSQVIEASALVSR